MIKKIIAIALAVVAIAMIGFGIYTMNSGSYIFKTIVTEFFDYATIAYGDYVDEINTLQENKRAKLSTANFLNVNEKELANITGDYYYDLSSSGRMYVNLESTLMNEDWLSLEAMLDENKLYLNFNKAVDKFFYTFLEEEININEIFDNNDVMLEKKEFNLIMNTLKQGFFDAISDNSINKKSTTIKINNKDYKTTKVSLNVSEKTTLETTKNILKRCINDEELIKILQKIDNKITKKVLRDALDEYEKIEHSEISTDTKLIVSFYVEGLNNIRRIDFSNDEISLTLDIYENNKKPVYALNYKNGDDIAFFAKQEYTNKTNSDFIIVGDHYYDSYEIEGTIDESEGLKIKFNFTKNSETICKFDFDHKEIKKDKEYKTSVSAILIFPEQYVEVNILSDNVIKFDEKMPNINLKNAEIADEMDEVDVEKIIKYMDDASVKLEGFLVHLVSIFDSNQYEEDNDESYDTLFYDEITVDEIEDLMDSDTPVILWMGSQYCNHCANFAEVLDYSYLDYDYNIYYIDADTLTDEDVEVLKSIDARLGSITTPTTLVLQNKKVKEIKRGTMSKNEYYAFLDSYGVKNKV